MKICIQYSIFLHFKIYKILQNSEKNFAKFGKFRKISAHFQNFAKSSEILNFFCGGGDKSSRKPGEKTTTYFPLVPKGNYVGARALENLSKRLAPLY